MYSTGNEYAVETLEAAFQGELNCQARYKAFAAQADHDELRGLASLFRAAARSEQIHSVNHSRVIRHMGGETGARPQPVQTRSTAENLQAALSGEQLEIESLYPHYINRVASHLDTRLVRTLTWALESEKAHARLLSDAKALLESGKPDTWIGNARIFYVCVVCGYTSETHEADYCPICNYPWERFETIR